MVEAIVLAGGQGTRLRSVVMDVPKPMAEIAGRPFLWWLMTRLNRQGVGRVILSLGYKSDVIQKYFGTKFEDIQIAYTVEKEPLGTGGAMKYALESATVQKVVVLNGDSYADINIRDLFYNFASGNGHLGVTVAYRRNSARYGSLIIDKKTNIITGFKEKQCHGAGHVNAGVYCLRRDIFEKYSGAAKFSFETDFLPTQLRALRPVALKGVRRFIDIGLPKDYALAQSLIPNLAGKYLLMSNKRSAATC
jgi:D-glycero-alpha-D-manno-heptose 1-phosphate guanylyltransferase